MSQVPLTLGHAVSLLPQLIQCPGGMAALWKEDSITDRVQNHRCMAIRDFKSGKLSRECAPHGTPTPAPLISWVPPLFLLLMLITYALLLTSLLQELSGEKLVRTQEKGALLLPGSYFWAHGASKEMTPLQRSSQTYEKGPGGLLFLLVFFFFLCLQLTTFNEEVLTIRRGNFHPNHSQDPRPHQQ